MPTQWELKSALIGFIRLSNAHSGERLGQALFKIILRIGIECKVCSLMQASPHSLLSHTYHHRLVT
jgi:hypothetical protein